MSIFDIIPALVIHGILALGILGLLAGFVLGFIPLINRYKFPIQVVSIVVFAFGVFFEGGLHEYRVWKLEEEKLKVKLAEAETKSAKTNIVVQEVVVEKTKVVTQKGEDIVRYIDRIQEIPVHIQGPEREKIVEVVKYIKDCPVPQLLIDTHNKATVINKGEDPKK